MRKVLEHWDGSELLSALFLYADLLNCPQMATAGVAYLGVADELPVEIGIKGLHMATVHIQHRLPNNTDLKAT